MPRTPPNPPSDPADPRAVVDAQVQAWNQGDLEGYLAHLHPDVHYLHGSTVCIGRDALRRHYQGRVHGTLRVQVRSEHRTASTAVLWLDAQLDPWRGQALLTLVHTDGRWWVIADATATLEPG